jgi:hypothetical protein
LAVGDPITVTVRIGGRGLLDSITLPDQPQWRDFKTYPASSRVETEDPLGLTGTKVFEQVIIPQNHEITVLPSVMFSYFDSTQRAYRTLSNAPMTLAVRHSSQVTVAPPALTNATEEARPPADDLIHIRVRPDGPAAGRKPWVRQPGYYVMLTIPALTWVGLTVARRRREALANNPRLRRRREVQAKVRRILEEMRAQAAAADAEGVYAGMFRVLQEQLGERLDLPASAITEAVIDERLRGCGLEAPVLEELHALFQACNQARYAPNAAPRELAAWPPRLEAILPSLEEIEP